MRTFLQKLNWRLILIHFIASWFLIHSFTFLVYLLQPQKAKDLISIVGDSKAVDNYILSDNGASFVELTAFEIDVDVLIALSIGQLLAIVTTLAISIKKKWFWVNSFIVILLLFVSYRYEHEQTLRYTILSFGRMFQYPILYLLVVGVVMLSLALFFFLYQPLNRFISKGQLTNYLQTKAIETT
jgi:hypothetical protein